MKKIYLLGLTSMFALALNAQTTLKVANPIKKAKTISTEQSTDKKKRNTSSNALRNNTGNNTIAQVTATMGCNTLYTAGTTMDINLVLEITNTNPEYGDSLSITFPASVTINSTTNMPNLGPDDGVASSDGPEAFNSINGQTISWGNDDNYYGGIVPSGDPAGPGTYPITINISIAPGTTGDITCDFHVDGDEFVSTTNPVPAADYDGTFVISEQQTANVTALGAQFLTVTGDACGLTSDNFAIIFKNNGLSAITPGTPGDSLVYLVNGVTTKVSSGDGVNSIMTDLTGTPVTTVAAGDTAAIIIAAPIDLSTPGTTYTVQSSLSFVGSGDANSADDAAADVVVTHLTPVNVAVGDYFDNFDAGIGNWVGEDLDASGLSILPVTTGTYQASAGALWFFENNVNGAFDNWGFSTCMDLVAGSVYYVRGFARLTTGYFGTLTYALSSDQASANVTQTIGTSAVTANSTYTKDSISFTAATSGTFFLGLHAVNTNAAGSMSIRVENVTVGLVPPVGIKTNIASDLVSIFPNPNAGVFTVKATENNSSVAVYSIIGENVYSSSLVKGNNTIELTNLAAGSYIVKINNGGTLVTKRVVINK